MATEQEQRHERHMSRLSRVVMRGTGAHAAYGEPVERFDYYDGTTTDMGGAAIRAARGLHRQLHALYPHHSARQLWAMEGNTILPGIDDYPKKTEVTHLADARRLLAFARSVGLSTLSAWAIQRDNGGCPGTIDSNGCSGIVQASWAFSHLLERFTSR